MTKKILVVDDEPDLLNVTSFRLKKTGYEAFGCMNGQEALNLARQKMPDLIVMDIYLPDIDGDEVAKILKKDEKFKHIPIILISATTKTLEERAKECGADGYFLKPFDLGELVAMIKKYVPL